MGYDLALTIDTNSTIIQSPLVSVHHDLVAHVTVRVVLYNHRMDAFTFDVLCELSHFRRG